MKKLEVSLLLFSCLFQNPEGGPPPGGGGRQMPDPTRHPLFRALDLNHDGVISTEEIAKASESLRAIANKEGSITSNELGRPGGSGAPGMPPTQNAEPKKIDEPTVEGVKSPFDTNVKVSFTQSWMIVQSDGIPTHKVGEFPNEHNPNRIEKQNYRFIIPRNPKIADKTTKLPMGPIGVAINGIPFYNPYNAEGNDAVMGPFAEVFDSCCGHPDQLGRYHYHKYPTCVKSPFKETEGQHSPMLGFAFDGFSLYGPNGEDGKAPTDLDDCNGHTDKTRGYHYHVTNKFPYILGAYKGVVDLSNFDQRGRFQGGRNAGPQPPVKKD